MTGAGGGGEGRGRDSMGAVLPVLLTTVVEETRMDETEEETTVVGWVDVDADVEVVSKRGIFI